MLAAFFGAGVFTVPWTPEEPLAGPGGGISAPTAAGTPKTATSAHAAATIPARPKNCFFTFGTPGRLLLSPPGSAAQHAPVVVSDQARQQEYECKEHYQQDNSHNNVRHRHDIEGGFGGKQLAGAAISEVTF